MFNIKLDFRDNKDFVLKVLNEFASTDGDIKCIIKNRCTNSISKLLNLKLLNIMNATVSLKFDDSICNISIIPLSFTYDKSHILITGEGSRNIDCGISYVILLFNTSTSCCTYCSELFEFNHGYCCRLECGEHDFCTDCALKCKATSKCPFEEKQLQNLPTGNLGKKGDGLQHGIRQKEIENE